MHICRDFYLYSNNLNFYQFGMYSLVIFLRSVMGFTTIGSTTLPIETTGGDWLKADGSGASINQGGSDQRAVAIPSATYTVSVSDVGRVLALQSNSNQRKNSGLFYILSVDVSNNWVYIDYRSPTEPPVEAGMNWAIYDGPEDVTFSSADNGAGDGTYETQGAALASRIIQQSPGGWQVRTCLEGPTDSANFVTRCSVSVGVNGDSNGDFPASGEHSHAGQYFNRTTTEFRNIVVGLGGGTDTTPSRIYMWGDTETETIVVVMRNASGGSSCICVFGMTEDEELPLPDKLAQRLFVVGSSVSGERLHFESGYSSANAIGGNALGLGLQPVSCVISQYVPLSQGRSDYFDSAFGAPYFRFSSADTTFLKQTELLHGEVIAGSWDSMNNSGDDPSIVSEVRRIGTCPIVRFGRSNIGDFQLTTDTNRSWFHAQNGIYLPWEGPSILP